MDTVQTNKNKNLISFCFFDNEQESYILYALESGGPKFIPYFKLFHKFLILSIKVLNL